MAITAAFRRHSRVLILVFMSVLMVVFVLGDALDGTCGRGSVLNERIGTAYGRPVTFFDLNRTESDLRVSGSLGVDFSDLPTSSRRLTEEDRRIGQHLLRLEAERLGVGVTDDQIREFLRAFQLNDSQIQQLRAGRSEAALFDAIRTGISIQMLATLQVSSGSGATLPQLQDLFRESSREARVTLSVVDSKPLQAVVSAPGESDLAELFEVGAQRVTGHTAEELVFGYQRPQRLKIQYVTINPDAIVDLVRIRERDVQAFFEANPQRYWRSVTGPGADGDAPLLPTTFEEVRDDVRRDFRAEKAVEEAQVALSRLADAARRPWMQGQPDEGQIVDLADLVDRPGNEFPMIVETTDWIEDADLQDLPGIGDAETAINPRQMAKFWRLALNLDEATTRDSTGVLPQLRLGEPGLIVYSTRTDAEGRRRPHQPYLWRVVAYEPPGPPDSLDESREQLARDALELRAFERARELAEQLADEARGVGLKQATADAVELRELLAQGAAAQDADAGVNYIEKLDAFEPRLLRRQPSLIRHLNICPLLHERVFEAIEAGASEENPVVIVVPHPELRQWIVAEVRGAKPLYEGPFAAQRSQLEMEIQRRIGKNLYAMWFDYDNIIARTQFVDQRKPRAPEDDEF